MAPSARDTTSFSYSFALNFRSRLTTVWRRTKDIFSGTMIMAEYPLICIQQPLKPRNYFHVLRSRRPMPNRYLLEGFTENSGVGGREVVRASVTRSSMTTLFLPPPPPLQPSAWQFCPSPIPRRTYARLSPLSNERLSRHPNVVIRGY